MSAAMRETESSLVCHVNALKRTWRPCPASLMHTAQAALMETPGAQWKAFNWGQTPRSLLQSARTKAAGSWPSKALQGAVQATGCKRLGPPLYCNSGSSLLDMRIPERPRMWDYALEEQRPFEDVAGPSGGYTGLAIDFGSAVEGAGTMILISLDRSEGSSAVVSNGNATVTLLCPSGMAVAGVHGWYSKHGPSMLGLICRTPGEAAALLGRQTTRLACLWPGHAAYTHVWPHTTTCLCGRSLSLGGCDNT